MTLLLGAIGWGLFTAGAISHLSHLERLELLLRSHVSFARTAARALAFTETAIAVAVPVALFVAPQSLLNVVGVIGFIVAVGFTAWVLRLFLTGSTLPCACSFSAAPTSIWSVLRAAATMLIGVLAFAARGQAGDDVATLLTGVAVALALFVVPDALAWPSWAQNMRSYAQRNAETQAAAAALHRDVRS